MRYELFTHGAIAQVGKFGIVGILNTIIDFVLFNILTSKRFNLSKITANICSTSVAMVFSFFANREAVFSAGTGNAWIQALLFFITTGFGLYVLQNGILFLLLEKWRWPKTFAASCLRLTSLQTKLSLDFVMKNGAKAAGTVVSLIWNFFIYKYVVFR